VEGNRKLLTNFATEKRLNRDGKTPSKNKNGKNEPFWAFIKLKGGKMNHFGHFQNLLAAFLWHLPVPAVHYSCQCRFAVIAIS
jgi:hypothetical protein